ncbi:MAG: SDR family NAD(P)-dependent oxidoreductase [Candidatus Dormibacteria bacterium]
MAAPPDPPLTVVGGASGALGHAVVRELSQRGHTVVAVVRAAADVPGASRTLVADLAGREGTEAVFREVASMGEVGALVNVAGGFAPGTVVAGPEGALREMLSLNLETTWWSCRAAAPLLARHGGGAIVNVASRSAVGPGGGAAAYAVSKAAVLRLTEVLAAELAPSKVRVNAILPGVIDTAANREALPPGRMAAAVPPSDLAAVIAFLISDAAWPISGALIPTYGWS